MAGIHLVCKAVKSVRAEKAINALLESEETAEATRIVEDIVENPSRTSHMPIVQAPMTVSPPRPPEPLAMCQLVPAQAVLQELIERLQLSVGAKDQAYGEVQGSPVTMTLLGGNPLALLFGFRIRSPHPSQIDLPDDVQAFLGRKKAEISLEQGISWFSLEDLRGETAQSIENLIRSFANGLSRANVHLPDGCAKCRSGDDVALVYAHRECNRFCAHCRGRIPVAHAEREAELNRPSLWFAVALPLVFLYVSCTWMVLWLLIDMNLPKAGVIFLNHLDFYLILPLLAAVAGLIGYPIGVFLRRSGMPGRTSWLASSAAVLATCAAGEWLYVATVLHRQGGVLDFTLAARLVVPFCANYHPSWKLAKFIVGAAIGVACYFGAKWRTLPVKL